ncbi:MAG TPA: alpha-L-fucosidase [Clostridiales bacterium]|nr:alpha-L-fucosidase [Clostridiales bacterium]
MHINYIFDEVLSEKNDKDFYFAYKDNNGIDKYGEEVDRLISVRPNSKQQIHNDIKYYNFIHFGMNTYTGREWGTGKEKPKQFKLKNFDADKVVKILKESGSQGIILTAKHHDGFCLWQTETTEHSIKNSQYKNGKGDIVKELSNACEKENMFFGIYLSPWDKNAKEYGKDEYNDFYLRQLNELTTRYGSLFEIWLDGAKDKKVENFKYNFDAFYSMIRENQPNAVIAIMGPDVRWIGNERGLIRENEWSVVPKHLSSFDDCLNQNNYNQKTLNVTSSKLGDRDILKRYESLMWYPAEMDISIRKGWFYHWFQKPKKSEDLEQIYYNSVGKNASLLLNVPLNKKGEIAKKDKEALEKFGEKIKSTLKNEIKYSASIGNTIKYRNILSEVLSSSDNKSVAFLEGEYLLNLKLDNKESVREIHIREDIVEGQRIEKFDIYFESKNKWLLVAKCGNVGSLRIVRFSDDLPKTDEIKIAISQSRSDPILRTIKIYSY